jgi:hypothetical protein
MICVATLIFAVSHFLVLRSRTHFRRYRGCQIPLSCFALSVSFWAVPRAPGLVFMFCAPELILGCTEGVGSNFHGLRHVLAFGGTVGVGTHFHVLRSHTHFLLYRGRRVPFSCFALFDPYLAVPRASGHVVIFALPDSFSAVTRATGLVFMFYALGPVLGGTEGVGSRCHVLRFRTHFCRYRWRRVQLLYFTLPDSFSAVPRASLPMFIFCAPRLIFGCIEGVMSTFHVLHSRTRFGRYRGRWVPFTCFALRGTFLAVPRASGPIFMFCAAELVLGGAEGAGSSFHVLRSRISCGRYRGCRAPFSYFEPSDTFSAEPRASVPVLGGIEGVMSRYHLL